MTLESSSGGEQVLSSVLEIGGGRRVNWSNQSPAMSSTLIHYRTNTQHLPHTHTHSHWITMACDVPRYQTCSAQMYEMDWIGMFLRLPLYAAFLRVWQKSWFAHSFIFFHFLSSSSIIFHHFSSFFYLCSSSFIFFYFPSSSFSHILSLSLIFFCLILSFLSSSTCFQLFSTFFNCQHCVVVSVAFSEMPLLQICYSQISCTHQCPELWFHELWWTMSAMSAMSAMRLCPLIMWCCVTLCPAQRTSQASFETLALLNSEWCATACKTRARSAWVWDSDCLGVSDMCRVMCAAASIAWWSQPGMRARCSKSPSAPTQY